MECEEGGVERRNGSVRAAVVESGVSIVMSESSFWSIWWDVDEDICFSKWREFCKLVLGLV